MSSALPNGTMPPPNISLEDRNVFCSTFDLKNVSKCCLYISYLFVFENK